jgi:two-component system sensor histidine kinase GlrK
MRITIFSRLILGNLVLLAIATGVSSYAVLQLGRMKGVTRQIIQVDNVLIDLNKEMIGSLLAETRYEKKYILLQDPALYEGFLVSKADFEKSLGKALELTGSTPAEEPLNQVRKLNQSYHDLFEKEISLLKKGGRLADKHFAQEKERLTNAAIGELTRLNAANQQSILRRVRELDEAGRKAGNVAMTITGVALLCGIALSIGITQSITHPLARMRKKTAEIAEGVFEADLDLSSPPEIGALACAFNTMCQKLKEVDRLKSNFYALMSHELRTPLTSIREGTNMFLEGLGGEVTEKQRELLRIISEESSRLIDMVNPLLELSKLEAGVAAFNFAPADLSQLISRAIREVIPLAESKNIRIESLVGNFPAISIDAEQMMQVMRNLIGNALKFTPPDGKVCVSAVRAEGEVRVAVSDTGPGIPKEEISIVFEKFRQGSQTRSDKFQGTGLGLAIVRQIVEKHGGRIWVESEVGVGSTFTLALPS